MFVSLALIFCDHDVFGLTGPNRWDQCQVNFSYEICTMVKV
jgi:hypothetical protein